ncbi:mandelate racemase/muconate lactonizing enzyme family protein [Maledivibacter halophilus]|uniref:Dipeptide epimerase n=1 Tax=Maledivibacter halophilus TaxID=36842 RepID=A0A1T5IHH3_9FIRM|nr:dipeptide epimerase [Maledivibacter halophilus]SKC38651.1 muconate cycloisomerase [Maledivibacter halophilus]
MKIKCIELKKISIPLKKTFKTALRTVDSADDIIIMVKTDDGKVGYGEAPPTAVITGDTSGSIIGAIKENIEKAIVGEEIENLERIMYKLDKTVVRNTSAKAAVDMAVYDLFGKLYKAPIYKLLGGYRDKIETDMTISVNEPKEMMEDALNFINQGFTALKMKIGTDSKQDIERVKAVRRAVGKDIKIRLDANQGWQPKEAVKIIRKIEDLGLDIELIEQPVKAWDIDGLKMVTDNVQTPIMADESIFTSYDAFKILSMRAADLINIKLMKCGGIHNALKIVAIAETCGVECMVGSMIESKLSVTAAAHLACAKKNIVRFDLDTALLLAQDPVIGGIKNEAPALIIPDTPGLGVERIDGLMDL